jgi:beta-galactosidase
VRHGRNRQSKLLHYYFNFSGEKRQVPYSYASGSDLLTGTAVQQGQIIKLGAWDLAIVSER